MSRIVITATAADADMADEADATGLTEDGYEEVFDTLLSIGLTDIDIKAAP